MANLTVRNIPEKDYAELQQDAKAKSAKYQRQDPVPSRRARLK